MITLMCYVRITFSFLCVFQKKTTLPTELFGVLSVRPRQGLFNIINNNFVVLCTRHLFVSFCFSNKSHTANGTVRCTKRPSAAGGESALGRVHLGRVVWVESALGRVGLGRVGPGPSSDLFATCHRCWGVVVLGFLESLTCLGFLRFLRFLGF